MPATKFDKPVFPGAKLVSATVTVTNTSGSYSNTFTDERIATSMRAFQLEIEDPSVFNDKISITTADGSFAIACDSVAGETDVTIGFLKIADDPTAVTSSEFTILNNRIGNLASLETTDKTSMVNAVNEVVDAVSDNTQDITSNTQAIENINTDIAYKYERVSGSAYSNGILFFRAGKVLIVTADGISALPAGGNTEICTIPSGYEPVSAADYYMCDVPVPSNNDGTGVRIVRGVIHGNKFSVYNYGTALTNTNARPSFFFVTT